MSLSKKLGKAVTARILKIDVEGNVYAFDSTTIDLCLSVFWWTEFRKRKGGIKLHTLYDVKTSTPSFLYITNAKVHDVNILDFIPYEAESFYVVDKAYPDFLRLYQLHTHGPFFITRAKDNMRFKRMHSRKANKTTEVLSDQIGKLGTNKSKKKNAQASFAELAITIRSTVRILSSLPTIQT